MPNIPTQWTPATTLPQLEPGWIHVWLVRNTPPVIEEGAALQRLASDEHERAGRFSHDGARRQFVTARACLRLLLDGYLDRPDNGPIPFAIGSHGKPYIPDAGAYGELRFNVAHSGPWAVIAVTAGHDVGVDIEHPRRKANFAGLAKRFFQPGETEKLLELSDGAEQAAAFYRFWTRKEAFVKGLGSGVPSGLRGLEVDGAPDCADALRGYERDPGVETRWRVASLPELPEPSPDIANALGLAGAVGQGAVAAEGRDWRLACYQWPTE
ncbi:MAG: 4'-phosphopantetheinyl transferase superfamily protein [Candidatus Hydrogenedentota bacterium]